MEVKKYFNPRSPWGERLAGAVLDLVGEDISIHAPRGGSDLDYQGGVNNRCHFNPRSPWGERPGVVSKAGVQQHISIHAPRGGSDYDCPVQCG